MTAFQTDATTTTNSLPIANSRDLVKQLMQQLQDKICDALEKLDGVGTFQEDAWQREEGGGGRSRVMTNGAIFEQGGVNFSEVWDSQLPPSILTQRPEAAGHGFFATGTSMVLLLVIPISRRFT